jgi:Fe2+ transport system protein FeoA
MRTLLNLNTGETAEIDHFSGSTYAGRLMSMGIIPGASVKLIRKSLSGAAAIYEIRKMQIALRSTEANQIVLK